jgi:hypothetical protein
LAGPLGIRSIAILTLFDYSSFFWFFAKVMKCACISCKDKVKGVVSNCFNIPSNSVLMAAKSFSVAFQFS